MVVIIPSLPRVSLSTSNDSLARKCLRICQYRDDLVRDDAPLPGERQGLVGFAHRPLDTRSACVAVLPAGLSQPDDVTACRDIGASLFFVAGDDRWNVWSQTREQPIHRQLLKTSEVENYFRQHRDQFAPGAIFRAKTWQRAGEGQQLDFVDADLLPMLERDAGLRLRNLFERMVATTMDFLDWKSVPDNDEEAHWLTKTNFWLLAAKLLHDKRVPRFINLDFGDVRTVFARIAYHYDRNNPNPPKINGRLRALQEAARLVAAPPHFRNISAETLGVLYEEALISPTTRKLLGTHRTPTYLVDYMLARLGGWIEELGHKRCHIFEPACGHAPFLSGALRLVSDMLPASIADDPNKRHDFLKDHLRGCDSDSFALEIARLSLTLADIPNENGWVLNDGDMFAGSTLANETKSASVVLANPPFESEQAAKFLQRTVPALQPGAVFGFVLPVNELTGAACADVRRQLLAECEIKEISVFPDRMFKFASVETGIVLGRKYEAKKATVTTGIRFRRVRESKMVDFRERYDDSWRDLIDAKWLTTKNNSRFVVPDLRRVWESCGSLSKFRRHADIVQGIIHHTSNHPEFPKDAITESEDRISGFVLGFSGMTNAPDTHLTPRTKWLNLDKNVVRFSSSEAGIPQILLNYAPVDRDIWRLKAYLDSVGRPATSRVLRIHPKYSADQLTALWALCNSPFANAYTYAWASKRDITAGLMRTMPVPDLNSCDLARLESAARTYLEVAKEFTATYQQPQTKTKSGAPKKKLPKQTARDQMHLGLPGQPTDEEIAGAKERLRALHWRVDAEVLRLYALPPELERELLDAFDGVPRVGVPFEQTCYIPREFRDVLTLDEFLRITDEWDATEARRCKLIEKRIKIGSRTSEEEKEFQQLQRLLMLHRRLYAPLPTAEIKVLAKQLKEESAWAQV
jgi:hypothetical protein